jgi:SEC-C motif domain protein
MEFVMLCPCGSQLHFEQCCDVYLQGEKAPSPETLMRSRYTAYAKGNIAYIKRTMRGKPLIGFDEQEAYAWAKQVLWVNLTIVNSRQISDERGYVEFIARFIERGTLNFIEEISEFHRQNGEWFYVDGERSAAKSQKNQKISRNGLCPCGSLRKFKNCHGKE